MAASACKRDDARDEPVPAAATSTKPSPPAEDTDFVWELHARVVVGYISGQDDAAHLVQRHEYGSEYLTYAFAPGEPAVADFALGDRRVVQLRISNLVRQGNQLKFDCSIATSWYWEGAGRSVMGCQLRSPEGVHLPMHRRFGSNGGEELRLEVIGWSVLSPGEEKGSAALVPRLVAADDPWQADHGHFKPAWDARARKPEAFVLPK